MSNGTIVLVKTDYENLLVRVFFPDGSGFGVRATTPGYDAALLEATHLGRAVDEDEYPPSSEDVDRVADSYRRRIGVDLRLPPSPLTHIIVRQCNTGPRWEAFRGVGGMLTPVTPEPPLGRRAMGVRKRRGGGLGSWPTSSEATEAAGRALTTAREEWVAEERTLVEAYGVRYTPPVFPPVMLTLTL